MVLRARRWTRVAVVIAIVTALDRGSVATAGGRPEIALDRTVVTAGGTIRVSFDCDGGTGYAFEAALVGVDRVGGQVSGMLVTRRVEAGPRVELALTLPGEAPLGLYEVTASCLLAPSAISHAEPVDVVVVGGRADPPAPVLQVPERAVRVGDVVDVAGSGCTLYGRTLPVHVSLNAGEQQQRQQPPVDGNGRFAASFRITPEYGPAPGEQRRFVGIDAYCAATANGSYDYDGWTFDRVDLTVCATAAVRCEPADGAWGYWLAGADGGVFAFGDAPFLGGVSHLRLNAPVVAMAATPTGRGYWLAAADGGVFAFGDARYHGGASHLPLNAPIVAMAATPTGRGYWLAAADGGVFTFGDAGFAGSATGRLPAGPATAFAASPTGHGYAVLARGVSLSFGDAYSPPIDTWDPSLVPPRIDIAIAASNDGDTVLQPDGGVLNDGLAPHWGSLGDRLLPARAVALAVLPGNAGYYIATADGMVIAFGYAKPLGTAMGLSLAAPIVDIAAPPTGVPATED